jgi:energy-coupling factor transport system ATP-binding protein
VSLPVAAVESASFRYAGRAQFTGPFALEVRRGEALLVSGPSGCGKSTLARLLCGSIPHLYRGELRGAVCIAGRASRDYPLWELAGRVGWVGQNPAAQILASTVRQEIAFGLRNLGLDDAEIERRTAAALSRFGLERIASRDPRHLSGGEQQRLTLAAVQARRPEVLVLDEPLSMLDDTAAAALIADLASLIDDGAAVIAFEHRLAALRQLRGLRRLALGTPSGGDPELPRLRALPGFRLTAHGLQVSKGGRPVLRGVDLDLRGGQVVCVLGDNGAGKTTLLRALAGLETADSGRVELRSSAAMRIGLAFQNPDRMLFNASVREELLCGLSQRDEELYRAVVELLGLAAYEQEPPLLLSEGEKKRLGVAVLLLQPGMAGLCLDEPTLGQDPVHRRSLGRIVRRLADCGYLCVAATHDREWAQQWADRLWELRGGCLWDLGAPAALRRGQEGAAAPAVEERALCA